MAGAKCHSRADHIVHFIVVQCDADRTAIEGLYQRVDSDGPIPGSTFHNSDLGFPQRSTLRGISGFGILAGAGFL